MLLLERRLLHGFGLVLPESAGVIGVIFPSNLFELALPESAGFMTVVFPLKPSPDDLLAAGLFSWVCAGALVAFGAGSFLTAGEQPVGTIKHPRRSKAEKQWRFMK